MREEARRWKCQNCRHSSLTPDSSRGLPELLLALPADGGWMNANPLNAPSSLHQPQVHSIDITSPSISPRDGITTTKLFAPHNTSSPTALRQEPQLLPPKTNCNGRQGDQGRRPRYATPKSAVACSFSSCEVARRRELAVSAAIAEPGASH